LGGASVQDSISEGVDEYAACPESAYQGSNNLVAKNNV
jgi:hypothetical protein